MMLIPPAKPMASIAINSLPFQIFAPNALKISLEHFVSCIKMTVGFLVAVFRFSMHFLIGVLHPLIFQETSFIEKV